MSRPSLFTARAGAIAAIALAATLTTSVARAGNGAPGTIPAPSTAAVHALEHDPRVMFAAGAMLISEPPMDGPHSPPPLARAHADDGMAARISESQAFALHSRPGADRVIFLDFDGHTISGTAWNEGRADPITVGSYSQESAGSENESFSQSELASIHEIWKRVSEDFAPWDVDVTTEHPGEAALHRTSVGDEQYGAHVVITHDSAWFGPSGGVAFIGAFGMPYYSPAFVFSSHLAQGSAHSVAEAATHEVGHQLGLLHDGTKGGTAYYAGHDDWAPIMGVGYTKQVTQWSKGEYSQADNKEDDLAAIDRFLPGRAARPGPVTLPGGDSTTEAVLETGGGADTYLLEVDGSTDITLSQVRPGGNLLAELVVTDVSDGQRIVRTLAPPDDPHGWTHSVDRLRAGSYEITVRSIAYGNASTGFSSYASIGGYVLDVDVTEAPGTGTPPATEPPPTDPAQQKDSEANQLTAMSPARLLDTRRPDSPETRLKAGEEIRIGVAGSGGVSDEAVAAVLNVVAVGPATNGFLSLTPCTDARDDERTSSLNFTAGRNIANSTIATLTGNGDVCIYSSAATDIVVDVTGSIGPEGTAGLASSALRRLVDTRTGEGLPGRLGPDERVEVSLAGAVAPDTVAVALNMTAIGASGPGFLTLDDCGSATGTAALNYWAGENRGNNGIFALSESKTLCLENTSALDLTIDLTGEFKPGGLTFVPADPLRLLDTRGSIRMARGANLSFEVPETNGAVAAAASVNIASAQHTRSGFVTAWSCGTMPEGSALNPVGGQVTANGALVPLTSSGSSCLFHSAGGQLIVDLNGWWV